MVTLNWQEFDDLLFEKLKSENLKPKWVKNCNIKIRNKYISIITVEGENYFDRIIHGIMVTWGTGDTYREVELIKFTIDELIEKIKLVILW